MAAINEDGLNLIKTFEGLRLNSYQDAVGVWTIGYGHTAGVREGQTITQDQAEQLLQSDVSTFSGGVAGLLKAPVTDNQFSALVSLAYNIGLGNFAKSTALKQVNAGNAVGAADAIELWNKGHVNGQLVLLPGLQARRVAEKALFLKPTGPTGDSPALEQNTRLPPGPERGNQRVNLSDSRTMQGGVVAGGAGAVAAAGAASQSASVEHAASTGCPPDTGAATSPVAGSAPPTTTSDAGSAASPPDAGTATSTPPSDGGASATPATPAATPCPPAPPAPIQAVPSSPSGTPAPATTPALPTTGASAPSQPPAMHAPAPTTTTTSKPLPTIVQNTAQVFRDYPEIYLTAAVLVILAVIWIIWARIDDWRAGRR